MTARQPPTISRSLRRMVSKRSSPKKNLSVGPVEIIKNPVGFLGADGQAGRAGSEGPLTPLALLPYESIGEIDIGEMVLAGDGVLKCVAEALSDALGLEHALGAAPVDRDLGFFQAGHFKGGSQKLP